MRAAWIVQGIGYALILAALMYAATRAVPDSTTSPRIAQQATSSAMSTSTMSTFALSTPAFTNGGAIPAKYTCDGDDMSPPLALDNAPQGTLTYAVIVEDPDAPAGTWDHWVVFNIPVEHTRLGEGEVPPGTEGTNSAGGTHFHGPCPPDGTHRYFFRAYALDTNLRLAPGVRKQEVLEAMKGHVLATAELTGVYERLETTD